MNTIAVIVAIIVILILGILYLNHLAKKKLKVTIQENEIKEPKVSYIAIKKSEVDNRNDQQDFVFDISTITKRGNELDILVTFQNNSTKHIRIDIQKATLVLKDQEIIGDHQLKEMTMGTNDIILKNTILSTGNLIRNIYFTTTENIEFQSNDLLKIELLINNDFFVLENTIGNSTVDKVKVIED